VISAHELIIQKKIANIRICAVSGFAKKGVGLMKRGKT